MTRHELRIDPDLGPRIWCSDQGGPNCAVPEPGECPDAGCESPACFEDGASGLIVHRDIGGGCDIDEWYGNDSVRWEGEPPAVPVEVAAWDDDGPTLRVSGGAA